MGCFVWTGSFGLVALWDASAACGGGLDLGHLPASRVVRSPNAFHEPPPQAAEASVPASRLMATYPPVRTRKPVIPKERREMLTPRMMPPIATEGPLSLFPPNRREVRAVTRQHPWHWIMPRSPLLLGG